MSRLFVIHGEWMKPELLLLVLALCMPCRLASQKTPSHKQATSDAQRPASDARSFTELFTKLERDWLEAVQRKDAVRLDEMLAPEFVQRTSADPEHPVLRADWMQNVLTKYDIRSFSYRAMAIRAFLGVAIVSFVQTQQAVIDGKKRDGDYFVVDLWVANHGKWQVAARYLSPVEKSGDSQAQVFGLESDGHSETSERAEACREAERPLCTSQRKSSGLSQSNHYQTC